MGGWNKGIASPARHDLTGRRFGRWAVIRLAAAGTHTSTPKWLCRCDCGVERAVARNSLVRGVSKSCGCLNREIITATRSKPGRKTPEYTVWMSMRDRCNNPNNKTFHRYGGRGITVCGRWNEFDNFLADMGSRPRKGFEIDRIDNDRGYSPDNCRWISHKNNTRNTRRSRFITHDGLTLTLAEWAERTGMNESKIRHRLNAGYPASVALTADDLTTYRGSGQKRAVAIKATRGEG